MAAAARYPNKTRYPNNARMLSAAARNQASADNRNTVVEGSTARSLEEFPVYVPPKRRPAPAPSPVRKPRPAVQKNRRAKSAAVPRTPKPLSEAAQKNRERAEGIGRGYVFFLAGVCVLILVICVHYLQLQTEITGRMKKVASLESELTQLKEDNDAYYSQVTSNVNFSEIKKIAIGRLGMRFPSEDQVVTYETEGRSYVRQFQDVPGAK